MKNKIYHKPVLLAQLLSKFELHENATIIDGTLGFAGHASAILTQFPNVHYIGFDKDLFALDYSRNQLSQYSNVQTFNQPFSEMFNVIKDKGIVPTHILLDLGVSSYQIDDSNRGFSFQKDEPLDMRMQPTQSLTAATILNTYAKDDLVQLMLEEGNVRFASKLVDEVIDARSHQPLRMTSDLIQCIKNAIHFRSRSQFIAETTRIFQAIRVEVNNEMGELDSFLSNILNYKDIIIGIITFQPNEDRRVKYFVKDHSLKAINKKPIQASYHDCKKNPREKTAKLRIFKV
jgi:16S rRNA (cytosine1402-N4)-methyltransferase